MYVYIENALTNDSDPVSSSKLTQVFHFEHCLVLHITSYLSTASTKRLILIFQTSCIVMDVSDLIYKLNGMYHHTLHDRTRIWRNIQDEI